MEFHEVANFFPLLTGDEFEEFKQDIKENGLLEPIWIYEDKIIDGRNRYRACMELGVDPQYRTWQNEGGSLVRFVVSMNARRRHLTKSQKAACAVLALPRLEEEAKQRQGARSDLATKVSESQIKGEAREIAGAALEVGTTYVSAAKRIKEEAPDLFSDIYAGDLSIPQAKRKINARRQKSISLNYDLDPQDLYENFKDLTWAIVKRAILEAVEYPENPEPREWLVGEDCRWYCEKLNKDYDMLTAWVEAGCPETPLHIQLIKTLEDQGKNL